MDGFDFPAPPEGRLEEEKRRPLLRPANLKRLAGEPLLWLAFLALLVVVLHGVLSTVCAGEERFCGAPGRAGLTALSLAALLGAGAGLRAAFLRYMLRRTQLAAGLLAALPAAYLIAADHSGAPPPAELVELPATPDLAPLELALAEAEAEMMLLADRIAAVEAERARIAVPGTPLASIEDVREIAAEEAARVAAADEERIAERLAAAEEEVVETIETRRRRSAALSAVGPRIAAAGPKLRPAGEEEAPAPLNDEMAFVADQLSFGPEERAALARNAPAQTCISTRLAERGPLTAFNHRVNKDRLAQYLAVCFTD